MAVLHIIEISQRDPAFSLAKGGSMSGGERAKAEG
jgi:hypothetical protein